MKNLMNRAKHVLNGEDGASNIEIIVWFSVVLVIASALYLFRNEIIAFLGRATGQVKDLKVQ